MRQTGIVRLRTKCAGKTTATGMAVYSTECGKGWGRHYRVYLMNSRQDKEFLEKNAFFG